MGNKIIVKTFGRMTIKIALYYVSCVVNDIDWKSDCVFTFRNRYDTVILYAKKNKDSITYECYYEGEK